MLTSQDKAWLNKKYPKLKPNQGGISGSIEFTAVYNSKDNLFSIIENEEEDTLDGVKLSGAFKIDIKERGDKFLSSLPEVYVDNVDLIPDRHFSQTDKTACLCSPLEEDEFLLPSFKFKTFFEELVIPFLYGQLFYSLNGEWPFSDYEHGAVGVLESYAKINNPNKADDCLKKLTHDRGAWSKIKKVLEDRIMVKGHTPCFCSKGDHVRRCHPKAWEGIKLLKEDVKNQNLRVDKYIYASNQKSNKKNSFNEKVS